MSQPIAPNILPQLKLLDPDGPESHHPLDAKETLIGRTSKADVTIVDPYVSRQHAKIIKGATGCSIVDLKSVQGTFVNDQRVQEQKLKHTDRIRIGRRELIFLDPDGKQDDVLSHENTAGDAFQASLIQFQSVVGTAEYAQVSDLEKVGHLLDFQYQWGQNFSPEGTFQHILSSSLEISGLERGFILVKQGDELSYSAGLDATKRVLSQSDFSASFSIVNQVVGSGKAVFKTGIEGDLAKQESVIALNLQAAACLPLKGIDLETNTHQLLGILYLDSKKPMHALSGLDEKILNKLAEAAGNVLEKLELIVSIEERKNFEQEMATAHETQKSLLPATLPAFANFEICAYSQPTRHVGGDFYDFIQPRDEELWGVLADVSGKGVPAALLSSMVQGALEMECRTSTSLGSVLEKLNRLLCIRSKPNDFVTLFLFSLDTDGAGHYLSAGHNPVYLFRAETGEIEELTSDGLILGAFDFATYRSAALQLNPGDVLVIYSDGVTEATGLDGGMLGEKKLRKVIHSTATSGAQKLRKQILETIEKFTEGVSQNDDITFVIVQAH